MASTLPFMPSDNERLEVPALEQWLWDAACVIRGATDAPKFKDFILPLIFYKRMSDVHDDEFAEQVTQWGSEQRADEYVRADLAQALRTGGQPLLRFHMPRQYAWRELRNHPADGSLGEFVTTAMREVAKLNPPLLGVLDIEDYNERQSGQRALDDERLRALIEVLSRHRLGLRNTEPDILGRVYEYLLRKFAEGQGQSAGEFYTPREVGWLLAELLDPAPRATILDPACGSGGLLIKARLLYDSRHDDGQAPHLYGQELNAVTFAMAKMNMFLHDYTDAHFAIGDSLRKPGFAAPGAGLWRFDYVIANPMWNQTGYDDAFYDQDEYRRFGHGAPPGSSADWGWVQHMLTSLNDHGRAAIVLDTGAVSRGSGGKSSNRERAVRRALVEADVIEGVVLLPENLFYNTTAPGIVLLLNRAKRRPRELLLVNASRHFVKEKPKNVLTDAGIRAVAEAHAAWETRPKLSRVVTMEEVRAADYNLSPSQFVEVGERAQHRPLADILADLAVARAERERADVALDRVLRELGLGG